MVNGKRVVLVLPAYNAAKTVERTYREIPFDVVDDVILTDDSSSDATVEVAVRLGIKHIVRHKKNLGYGANQKTCYQKALTLGADIVIMLHPDYQYTPKLVPAMVSPIANGIFPVMLASRILGRGALEGGMPIYKYVANRFLTLVQNVCTGAKLSEYHTGFRAYSSAVLATIPFEKNSDSHIFDNEILSQIILAGFSIGEIACPTRYFEEASSLNFGKSVRYGFGVLRVSALHVWRRTFQKKQPF